MRIGAWSKDSGEVDAILRNEVPVPIIETVTARALTQALFVACKLRIFDRLLSAASAEELARDVGTSERATKRLLDALAASGYLSIDGDRYLCTERSAKWLCTSRHESLVGAITQMGALDFRWIDHLEEYVATGRPIDVHIDMSDEGWDLYQKAMRSYAPSTAPEVISCFHFSHDPKRMLDIGGSHGFYSAEFCRRFPSLSSVILDLPDAIAHAKPLLEKEGLSDRVTYRAGDIRTTTLEPDT